MIAFDTNILVHAHRAESPFHQAAFAAVKRAAEGATPWATTWTNLHEFLAVVTHTKIFKQPTPIEQALVQVNAWRNSPSLVVLGEEESYWLVLAEIIGKGQVTGPRIHDARVAALCLLHQVEVLYTADRDFSRFPGLKTANPLIGEH